MEGGFKMARKPIDYYIRNERERELTDLADDLAVQFAKRASMHDVEGSFPFDNFQDMKDAGYLKLSVPKEYGGDDLSLYELVLVQERLARGDGATALAVGWHMGMVLSLRNTRAWPEEIFADFCRDVVADGAMINSFASGTATGSPSRGGKPETKAERTADGWVITGRKTWSTLCPILDRFILSAGIVGEDRVGEFLVRKTEGVRIEETWNTMGMRSTGSHDVILDHVSVPKNALLELTEAQKKSRRHSDGSGWMLHIPAAYIGIAYGARDFAVEFARTYRPNSLPGPIADLPHIQDKIGRMEVLLRTARAQLYATAARWDENVEGRTHLRNELGLAKYVATNYALEVVDQAMRIVGGTSMFRSLPLERMYRDVRAGLHNPPMDDAVLRGLAQTALQEND